MSAQSAAPKFFTQIGTEVSQKLLWYVILFSFAVWEGKVYLHYPNKSSAEKTVIMLSVLPASEPFSHDKNLMLQQTAFH